MPTRLQTHGANTVELSVEWTFPSGYVGSGKETNRICEISFLQSKYHLFRASFLSSIYNSCLLISKYMKKYTTVCVKILRGLEKKKKLQLLLRFIYYSSPIAIFENKKVKHLHEKKYLKLNISNCLTKTYIPFLIFCYLWEHVKQGSNHDYTYLTYLDVSLN